MDVVEPKVYTWKTANWYDAVFNGMKKHNWIISMDAMKALASFCYRCHTYIEEHLHLNLEFSLDESNNICLDTNPAPIIKCAQEHYEEMYYHSKRRASGATRRDFNALTKFLKSDEYKILAGIPLVKREIKDDNDESPDEDDSTNPPDITNQLTDMVYALATICCKCGFDKQPLVELVADTIELAYENEGGK